MKVTSIAASATSAILLSGLLVLAACDGTALSPEDPLELSVNPPIRTSADEYVLETTSVGWQAQIPFTYGNHSEGSYYLVNCNGAYEFRLEKRVEDRGAEDPWVPAYYPTLPACLSPVIQIEAGVSFDSAIILFAGFPDNNFHPKFEIVAPEGIYRIVLETLTSFDADRYPFGSLIPLGQRVSNEFRLVTADQATN